MRGVNRDIGEQAHEWMVGDRHEVLVVEQGTADSVKCRDGAYRQVIVQNASEHGVEPGEFREVEVTGQNTMYAFGEPV